MQFASKNILDMESLSVDEINMVLDTADSMKEIEAMHPDIIVIRHSAAGAPHLPARMVKAAIINAGDGMHAHPAQSLLYLVAGGLRDAGAD